MLRVFLRPRFSAMINGSPSSEFKMECGLRQGDPLSPILFLIVTEVLQINILEAGNKGLYSGVSLAGCGENVSLLQYADDAMFFGEWSRRNALNLIHILKCFELGWGLKVNISKSRILGVEVSAAEIEVVASSIGCAHETFPFYYLSSWKAKSLLIGGRLTLVKSVLGSLPIYYLSLFKAPASIINRLEAIRCHFFRVFLSRSMASIGLNGILSFLIENWVRSWKSSRKESWSFV